MILNIAQSALADLQQIQQYYLEQGSADVGQKILQEIFQQIEMIVAHPDAGRIVPEFAQLQIREIIYPPFRIVYLREVDSVQLIRVWRSERLLILPP
ncbi:type II toxin-antitoxin system RelE/ParE family toxin [Rheinheimera riviphila]|uniref:Type II toxin-antitoxin system RelE/ParE family toxin n=1 Tax=Rheinheimera riviphila TaxID=1834037 RepID=A0A437QGE6_9GAMM|nr:type II toxin-antitoxin system RelE/ParE family toxin [Rheinheimera riviphila]RVU33494.1 type II toxin-antitoxin system RelE/ParE family toxin [Rheinheimera riviphila]